MVLDGKPVGQSGKKFGTNFVPRKQVATVIGWIPTPSDTLMPLLLLLRTLMLITCQRRKRLILVLWAVKMAIRSKSPILKLAMWYSHNLIRRVHPIKSPM